MNRYPELVRELKALRKGGGVHASRIDQRVGPTLRATCGITGLDGPLAIREKVSARLGELVDRLPPELGLPAQAAFAIKGVRLPLYQDRVRWAAMRLDRDPRTVRRRVDDAIARLAEMAAELPPARLGGWRTTELRVAVALDRAQPEVLVQRRVVADQDGVGELEIAAPIQVTRPEVDVRVLYGGTVGARGTADGRVAFALTPPAPIQRGAAHDIGLVYRLPSAQALRPHLVCVPQHPWELFELRVRFGIGAGVPRVWTLPGADGAETGSPVPVDGAGEVHARFRKLVPGLAYGARWTGGCGIPTP
ncbi:hypothetical protein [Actinokineospora sp. NPDC004072]